MYEVYNIVTKENLEEKVLYQLFTKPDFNMDEETIKRLELVKAKDILKNKSSVIPPAVSPIFETIDEIAEWCSNNLDDICEDPLISRISTYTEIFHAYKDYLEDILSSDSDASIDYMTHYVVKKLRSNPTTK
jgi:hypothetical protein